MQGTGIIMVQVAMMGVEESEGNVFQKRTQVGSEEVMMEGKGKSKHENSRD